MRSPAAALGILLALLAAACAGGDGSDERAREAAATGETPTTTATTTPQTPGADVFGGIPQIVENVQPSVVTILRPGGEGSGVIYGEDGIIITNWHVIQGADIVTVQLASGERLDARVRASDERTDLAVLEVDRESLPAATFSDVLPRVGSLAIAMGNPLGFENTVTAGIVSGLNRAIPAQGQAPALVELIQTDAPISPGNSGGALVDAEGRVIGVNVAYIPPQETGGVDLGFAIPAPTVTDVVEQLLGTGSVRHAYLGVFFQPLTPDVAQAFGLDVDQGVLVQQIEPGGPADTSELQRGDVIVGFAGEEVASPEDLFAGLRRQDPGDSVEVTVVRDGERRTLEITLGERPD